MSNREETHMLIDDYLNNRLTEDPMTDFEKRLKEEAELAEEVVIHQNLMHIIGEQVDKRRKPAIDHPAVKEVTEMLYSAELRQIRATIAEVNAAYQQTLQSARDKKPRKLPLLAIAASVAILLTFGMIFWYQTSDMGLYEQYKDSYSPVSLVERSSGTTDFQEITEAFLAENYDRVIQSIENSPDLVAQHSEVLLYLGLSYRETEQYEQAIRAFSQYGEINDLDHALVDWNLGLIYLKTGDQRKAKAYFTELSQTDEFEGSDAAAEILRSLE